MADECSGGSNPKQYGIPENSKELQDLIEYRNMNFAIGNIFKAYYRMGQCDHSSELRDLRKIKWFAEREIARINQGRCAQSERASSRSINGAVVGSVLVGDPPSNASWTILEEDIDG